jgi:hypothetical protein
VSQTDRAWIGRPWPGSRCSTGNPRNRVQVFTAAASGANLGRPLLEITASPESRVREGSCQKAMLSSVWQGCSPRSRLTPPAALLRRAGRVPGHNPVWSRTPWLMWRGRNPARPWRRTADRNRTGDHALWRAGSGQVRTNFATAGVRGRCTPSRFTSVIAGTWISAPPHCTVAAAHPLGRGARG